MSPKNSLLSVRVSDEVKEKAAEVLADYGLTVSDAARILLTRIAKEGGLPPFLVCSEEQYDAWFTGKVLEAMNDTRPSIPHAQAVASIRENLAKAAL